MTATTVLGFVAPAPLDAATSVGAWTESGRRKVSWSIIAPGVFARNSFAMAWIEVVEQVPFRGEPLSVWAQRRIDEDSPRESFTDAARARLVEAIVPGVVRYGFDRLWTEIHRSHYEPGSNGRAVARAEAVLAWHRNQATLVEMHADGLVTFDRVGFHEGTAWTTTQRDSPGPQRSVDHDGRVVWQTVIARAVVNGEHVGWLDDHTRLIPLGHELAEHR